MENNSLFFESSSEEMTAAIASVVAACMPDASCIGLSGTLGAGKSVFARGFARSLGITGSIPSPSYPIILEYPGSPGLCHMDWYRLFDESELEETGMFEYLSVPGWICLIEWWNKFPRYMPEDALLVEITLAGPECRHIRIGYLHDTASDGQGAVLDRIRLQTEPFLKSKDA